MIRSPIGNNLGPVFAQHQIQCPRNSNILPDASTLVSTFNEYSDQGNGSITNNPSNVVFNPSYNYSNNMNVTGVDNASRVSAEQYLPAARTPSSPRDHMFTSYDNSDQNDDDDDIINYRAVFDDDNSLNNSIEEPILQQLNSNNRNIQSSTSRSRSTCGANENSTNNSVQNNIASTSTNIYDLTSVPDGTSLDDAIFIE